ncbi:MAG: hypothetical protein AAFS12_18470 [Cyanobacteria bacterium J06632_19]
MKITKVVGLLCITLGFSSMNFASAYAQTTPEQKVSIREAQLVLPQGEVLEEQALADVEGEGLPVWVTSAAVGAGAGGLQQAILNTALGEVWHKDLPEAMLGGAVGGVLNPLSTTTKLTRVGSSLYKVTKPVTRSSISCRKFQGWRFFRFYYRNAFVVKPVAEST